MLGSKPDQMQIAPCAETPCEAECHPCEVIASTHLCPCIIPCCKTQAAAASVSSCDTSIAHLSSKIATLPQGQKMQLNPHQHCCASLPTLHFSQDWLGVTCLDLQVYTLKQQQQSIGNFMETSKLAVDSQQCLQSKPLLSVLKALVRPRHPYSGTTARSAPRVRI